MMAPFSIGYFLSTIILIYMPVVLATGPDCKVSLMATCLNVEVNGEHIRS